jgi:anti-anti-sigma regulatory factor
MLKIETTQNTKTRTVLTLSGDVHAGDVAQLQHLVRSAGETSSEVQIDCREIRLLDREVVRFLATCRLGRVRLTHAPAYVREWLRLERRNGK